MQIVCPYRLWLVRNGTCSLSFEAIHYDNETKPAHFRKLHGDKIGTQCLRGNSLASAVFEDMVVAINVGPITIKQHLSWVNFSKGIIFHRIPSQKSMFSKQNKTVGGVDRYPTTNDGDLAFLLSFCYYSK